MQFRFVVIGTVVETIAAMLVGSIKICHGIEHTFVDAAITVVVQSVANLDVVILDFTVRPNESAVFFIAPLESDARIEMT